MICKEILLKNSTSAQAQMLIEYNMHRIKQQQWVEIGLKQSKETLSCRVKSVRLTCHKKSGINKTEHSGL